MKKLLMLNAAVALCTAFFRIRLAMLAGTSPRAQSQRAKIVDGIESHAQPVGYIHLPTLTR